MTDYQEQHIDAEGTDHRPHVSIVMNLTKPTEEKPSLLTPGEVETFLHEFGHALHSIFSKVRYKGQSGTNVQRDFVELPSQLMENFAIEPDFLHTFAFHFETGEPLPDELIERIRQSRNFHCGYGCIRQLRTQSMEPHTAPAHHSRHEHERAVLAHHEWWLCGRLLQLQVGRGARC